MKVERFKIIAFTHKSAEQKDLGRFFIDDKSLNERLTLIKEKSGLDELMYLSTCNRVEFLFSTEQRADKNFQTKFFHAYNSSWNQQEIEWAVAHSFVLEGEEAVKHVLEVASSLDSMVVGEREIITQVRKAYDTCRELNLTGDFMRLVIQSTIKTAKEIFTQTRIAQNPVSIVSLAYRKLRDMDINTGSRILIIGAGQTSSTMAKYLLKHGFRNFTVFNRTVSNAEALAKELSCKAYSLSDLPVFKDGFDVMITCTGSAEPVVTESIYRNLLRGDEKRKIVIDLALPNDIDSEVIKKHNIHYIEIQTLKAVAEKNLEERKKELIVADKIVMQNLEEFRQGLKVRRVELAMQDVPKKIREIRNNAVNAVFAKDIEQLDPSSREVLEKVLEYMEKKCIGVPMVMAKDILIGEESLDAKPN